MRKEIIEILQNAYPEHCLKHIDTANNILRLFSRSNSDSEIEEKRDMEDFGNYAGIGFNDD